MLDCLHLGVAGDGEAESNPSFHLSMAKYMALAAQCLSVYQGTAQGLSD